MLEILIILFNISYKTEGPLKELRSHFASALNVFGPRQEHFVLR